MKTILSSAIILAVILTGGILFAKAKSSDQQIEYHPRTKTIEVNGYFVRAPWTMPQATIKKVGELLPGKQIADISHPGELITVKVVTRSEKRKDQDLISGPTLHVNPTTWKVEKGGTWGATANTFIAEDRQIWDSFRTYSHQILKGTGGTLSRSHRTYFVPGESFQLNDGRVTLKYFAGTGVKAEFVYATIVLGKICGMRGNAQQPPERDK